VVDRLDQARPGEALESSIDVAMKLTKGIVLIAIVGGDERLYSEKLACVDCGISFRR
jgi:excinuclease ABC subunit A